MINLDKEESYEYKKAEKCRLRDGYSGIGRLVRQFAGQRG